MYARFGLCPAVGIRTGYLEGRRLDARFLSRGLADLLDPESPLLRPPTVHAHEHLGPVLALRSSGAGMNLEIAVVAVRLTGKKALYAKLLGPDAEFPERVHALRDEVFLALDFGEFSEFDVVREFRFQGAHITDGIGKACPLPQQCPGPGGIAPEIGVLGQVLEFIEAGDGIFPVKDASGQDQGRLRCCLSVRQYWDA